MNEKLKKYLETFAFNRSPFGTAVSSAQKLEQDLVKRGIKLPIKLYYQYALPEGMKSADFMMRLAILGLCADFGFDAKKDIFFDKSLSLIEKLKIVNYIKSEYKSSRQKIKEYVRFIQFANPELSKLKPGNDMDDFHFLAGVTFGFAPDEISYFIDKKNRDVNQERKIHERIERFGIRPSYVLAPKTAEIVLKELEKQRVMIKPNVSRNVRTI